MLLVMFSSCLLFLEHLFGEIYCFDQTLNKSVNPHTWKQISETSNGDQTEIKIDNLTPLHHFRFRVKAKNEGGFSDAVETIDIIMKEDPGERLFQIFAQNENLMLTLNKIIHSET